MELSSKNQYLIQGGVGDFLQCLPFIIANKSNNLKYFVVTHFKGAFEFFDVLEIKVEKIYFFNSQSEYEETFLELNKKRELLSCPRQNYFEENPLEIKNSLFVGGRIIGIHLGGSKYSIDIQKKYGKVSKKLPRKILEGIIAKEFNYIIFGSEEEIKELDIRNSENIRVVCDDSILSSLSYVSQCELLIGSDSAFKTMSSMLKIPTIVWVGDYRDNIRDKVFIDPYLLDSVLYAFRYKNLDEGEDFNLGVQFTKSIIDILFSLKDQNRDKSYALISRNEMCPCGSHQKYKHCHGKVF